jgi:hypothetical protein
MNTKHVKNVAVDIPNLAATFWVLGCFDTDGEVVQALVRCIGIVVIEDRHSEVYHASPDADRTHSI